MEGYEVEVLLVRVLIWEGRFGEFLYYYNSFIFVVMLYWDNCFFVDVVFVEEVDLVN